MYLVWVVLLCNFWYIQIQNVKGEERATCVSSNGRLGICVNSIGALSKKKCQDFYQPVTGIVGGNASLPKEFPHMAIIGFGEENAIQWECGGSLISRDFVLTAAHCLQSGHMGPAKWVRLGDLDLATDKDDAQPQQFSVKRGIAHPLYKRPVKYHDIALLELDRPANVTLYVAPACLHTEYDLEETMTATGWGKTDFLGVPSSFLLKVDLNHIPNDRCVKTFGKISPKFLPNGIVDEWQICAGETAGKDTCQGDSGGPLQVPNNERTYVIRVHTVVGITSLGRACGLSAVPGIFTRVSHYLPWIESVVWPEENVTSH